MSSSLVDLSHDVEHGMITYRGLPAPLICDYLTREESRSHYSAGTTFQIGRIDMVANTGTYVDAPFHRYEDGKDLAALPLSSLANLDGVVVSVPPGTTAVGPEALGGHDLEGKAVLIRTGWDRHWRTDSYFEGHPFLTREAALWLRSAGAALVGIDSYNIDDTTDGTRPVHSILLAAEIPIAEHLCHLDQLPRSGFDFYAVPVKVRGLGTFPVRAFGRLHSAP